MALALGDANFGVEFVFPTSEEVGHPSERFAPQPQDEWVASRENE